VGTPGRAIHRGTGRIGRSVGPASAHGSRWFAMLNDVEHRVGEVALGRPQPGADRNRRGGTRELARGRGDLRLPVHMSAWARVEPEVEGLARAGHREVAAVRTGAAAGPAFSTPRWPSSHSWPRGGTAVDRMRRGRSARARPVHAVPDFARGST
jgi:hypothetical protein